VLLIRKWQKFLALGALTDLRGEFFNVVENLAAVRHLSKNLALCVHHRRVVATEGLADFR
jgi:hypothetical protein